MFPPVSVCAFFFGEVGGRLGTREGSRCVRFPDGESMPSVPFLPENMPRGTRCPDCDVNIGGFHNPWCSRAKCPR